MTGYATHTLQLENLTILFDIRSVNHRFFDLNIKMSEDLRCLEPIIRDKISSKFTRGKFDIKITSKSNASSSVLNMTLNNAYLDRYADILQQISEKINVSPPNAIQIMELSGVVTHTAQEPEQFKNVILQSLDQLLEELQISTQTEGTKLAAVILAKILQIKSIVDDAIKIIPTIRNSYKERLKQKLVEALSESMQNEQRFQQEFAYFCQKIDVDEELTRLQSHITQSLNLINLGGNIGKKFDFITQEMHREANTFGAKSVSIETSELAVNLKVLIEQIKEQIQNIA